MQLDMAAARVLGAMMEKEMTTPDAYPLTLNAIIVAANQRSCRDPILDLTEADVRSALATLDTESLAVRARDGGRVSRYEHRIRTVLNLRRDETAILCVLLLRGAQTVGELRGRTDRMHSFEDLASVQAALDRLAGREAPLVRALPRAPGSREVRWGHLFFGGTAAETVFETDARQDETSRTPVSGMAPGETVALREALDQLASLEDRVEQLERRLDALAPAPRP